MNLLTHIGNGSDQLAFDRHSRWSAPMRLYPILQVWLTIEPTVVDMTKVFPF